MISKLMTLLALSLLAAPFNIPVLFGLRLADLVCLVLIGFWAGFLRIPVLILIVLAFLGCAVLVSGLKTPVLGTEQLERALFFHKYLLLLVIPVIFLSVARSSVGFLNGTRRVGFGYFVVLIFSICWVYWYVFAQTDGRIEGSYRVSFPALGSHSQTDAHLYSAFLSMMLIAYVGSLGKQMRHPMFVIAAVGALGIGALLLTGSRSGIVAIIFATTIYAFLSVSRILRSVKIHHLRQKMIMIFVGVGLLIILWQSLSQDFDRLVGRALLLNLGTDESALGRISKFETALEQVMNSDPLFGAGIFNASLLWYDGIIGIILAHFGLLGLLIGVCLCALFLRKLIHYSEPDTPVRRTVVVCFLSFVLLNFITEYALVTRFLVPAMAACTLPLFDLERAFQPRRKIYRRFGRTKPSIEQNGETQPHA